MLENKDKIIDKSDKNENIELILEQVYASLKEKGYSPAKQIAGYILSEDPLYMPDYNNARGLISRIDRDELLDLIIEYYLQNRFKN